MKKEIVKKKLKTKTWTKKSRKKRMKNVNAEEWTKNEERIRKEKLKTKKVNEGK